MIVLGILAVILALLVGFAIGVRYCATKLMPVLLARMTPKELSELAAKAAAERPDNE